MTRQLALVLALLLEVAMTRQPQEATAHPEQTSITRSEAAADTPAADASHRAPPPVAIRIAAAGVNGLVETSEIVDGELAAPSGPWVVAWYVQTARPGETGNVVMGGHVDYWDIGPAVFAGLGRLEKGAEIDVTDAAGERYVYIVEWARDYPVAGLTPDQLREIVGPTESPSLTLITCGGEFDYGRGEYLKRLVIRAARVES
jgi:hypothetical protein